MNIDEINEMIDSLVERAKVASKKFNELNQEEVDRIVKAMAMAAIENHMKLAKMAVLETKRGIYEDKITKNMFASEYIYHSIKYDKTVGVIDEVDDDYELVAEPVSIPLNKSPSAEPVSVPVPCTAASISSLSSYGRASNSFTVKKNPF